MSRPASKMMVSEPKAGGQPHADFGEHSTLGKISKCMEPNAFAILLDLVNWAKLWDQCYLAGTEPDKHPMAWDDSTIRALMTPFIGFGNNPRLYAVVSDKVTALIGREMPLWLGDPAYRKANSMVWCVLQSLGPSLASSSHGFQGQQEVVKILSEGFAE